MPFHVPSALLLASAFIAGLLAATWIGPPGSVLLMAVGIGLTAAAAVGLGIVVLSWRRLPPALPLALALGLGLLRGASALSTSLQPWVEAPAERIELVGRVDSPLQTRGTASFVDLAVESVESRSPIAPPAGNVRLTVPALSAVELGDRLRVVGRFEAVDSATPTGRGLLTHGIVAVSAYPDFQSMGPASSGPWIGLNRIRDALADAIDLALPEPQAALLIGLLVGGTASMSDELRQALIASGTMPLVVVSGYNITLVAAALASFLRGSAVARAVIPIVGVWLFALVAGATASAIRAALMATIALGAVRLGRGADPLGSLVLTVAAMLALTPTSALDLGFQLSALGTLGLITLQPRIAALLPRLPQPAREPLAGTLAAQLATLPVLASAFHQLSTVAPLANTLAAPMVPAATIAAAIAAPVVALLPAAAPLATAVLAVPTTYLLAVISFTASLPQALVPVGSLPNVIVALYALALMAWAALPTPEGRDLLANLRARPLVLAGALAGAAGLSASLFLGSQPPSPALLSLSVFDGGGAAGFLLQAPAGARLLIDGGRSPSAVTTALGRGMPLTSHELAMAILTRADPDRLPGMLAALDRYPAGLTFVPPEPIPTPFAERWRAAVAQRSIVATQPMAVDLEPGLQIQLFPTTPVPATSGPGNPARTIAVRLQYRDVALLVAPSLTPESARALVRQGYALEAPVWFVPRNATLASFDRTTLAAIRPRLAIIPLDTGLRAAEPNGELLALLGGIPTYRTDLNGAIEITTDGHRIWARTERSP